MPSQKLLKDLRALLEPFDHLHLLQEVASLEIEEIKQLHHQLKDYSGDLLFRQRQALSVKRETQDLRPWLDVSIPLPSEKGEAAIFDGKVASVILAGGQGTRLGWSGPKALYPIFPEQNITLLQILLQKVGHVSRGKAKAPPVAVMTSPLNHQAIAKYVAHEDGCGLKQEQLILFPQKMLPLLDEQGNWFLEKPGQICMGPNGNGGVFNLLMTLGIFEKWKKAGIEYVTVVPIENPLAEPFDLKQIDLLVKAKADVVAKCIERIQPDEKVGVFAKQEGRLHVVEYSEMAEQEKCALDADGRLVWPYANIGQFAFSMDFIERMATVPLPWHIARKTANAWGKGEISAIKCETFLFDVLPYAKNPKLLLYPREISHAPLKNQSGDKSPEMVRAQYMHYHKSMINSPS